MRPTRTRKWTLSIAAAVTTAGIGACIDTRRPAPPAPVVTATQPAPAAQPAPATAAPAASPQHAHDHGAEAAVPRMTPSELRTAMDKGEVVVVDVRDVRSYTAGHIPGALSIPLASMQSQAASLPKDKTLVTYCT